MEYDKEHEKKRKKQGRGKRRSRDGAWGRGKPQRFEQRPGTVLHCLRELESGENERKRKNERKRESRRTMDAASHR